MATQHRDNFIVPAVKSTQNHASEQSGSGACEVRKRGLAQRLCIGSGLTCMECFAWRKSAKWPSREGSKKHKGLYPVSCGFMVEVKCFLQSISLLLRDSEFRTNTVVRFLFRPRRELVLPQPLPTPEDLKERPDLIRRRYDGIGALRQISSFRSHDSPTASIYRMCEFICADESNQLMLETLYFWNNSSWILEAIPDPHDGNKERYAILAAVVESLVGAFNYRLSLGLQRGESERREERYPLWTSSVPSLDSPLTLRKDTDFDFPDSPPNAFSCRQIDANAGNIYSI